VVLLDLNLPATSGMEFLRWLKTEDELREIPVVIVSGREDDRAIAEGRELGAHSHMCKPITSRALVWIVTTVDNYRSRLGRLPPVGPEA
jgi:DNA-binding response OmpR family regulator